MAEMLLSYGVDVNANSPHDASPLYEAYINRRKELYALLISHGAVLNENDIREREALVELMYTALWDLPLQLMRCAHLHIRSVTTATAEDDAHRENMAALLTRENSRCRELIDFCYETFCLWKTKLPVYEVDLLLLSIFVRVFDLPVIMSTSLYILYRLLHRPCSASLFAVFRERSKMDAWKCLITMTLVMFVLLGLFPYGVASLLGSFAVKCNVTFRGILTGYTFFDVASFIA